MKIKLWYGWTRKTPHGGFAMQVLRGVENVRDVRQHLGRLVNTMLSNGHV